MPLLWACWLLDYHCAKPRRSAARPPDFSHCASTFGIIRRPFTQQSISVNLWATFKICRPTSTCFVSWKSGATSRDYLGIYLQGDKRAIYFLVFARGTCFFSLFCLSLRCAVYLIGWAGTKVLDLFFMNTRSLILFIDNVKTVPRVLEILDLCEEFVEVFDGYST